MKRASQSITYVIIILACMFCIPVIHSAHAWGERGHDLISRVAVRLLKNRHSAAPELITPFLMKEHMLGHLANVPDIVWRNSDSKTRRLNGPTHYFSYDLIAEAPFQNPMPYAYKQVLETVKALHKHRTGVKVGSAPWRIQQLARLMRDAFAEIKGKRKSKGKSLIQNTNLALLNGGLLSHFVGDLANPMHTVKDYDGFARGQGGLHAYFESILVSEADLDLISEVYAAALKNPLAKLRQQHRKFVPAADTPLEIALLVTRDSFMNANALFALDRAHGLIKESTTEPLKMPALRKPPADVLRHFKPLIVERLAVAADALANIWYWTWRMGGKPNLRSYKSFEYPVKPDFVVPNYE